uniref:Biogenesis of lysosome-related organelles complex 1 subunit 7 n=2 Tax=Lepisosteus oculatus TaxID=7918 RepID=W5MID0_LEPOC
MHLVLLRHHDRFVYISCPPLPPPRHSFHRCQKTRRLHFPRVIAAHSSCRAYKHCHSGLHFPVGSVEGIAGMAAVAVIETPSGKDAIAEGLLDLLKPAVQQLDMHVHSVRESQVELREHIDNLATELCRINDHQKVALDLDPYVKKLLNARRRVVLVNNILQNAQERLRRLNHSVAKETARRKTMLETTGAFVPRSPSKP